MRRLGIVVAIVLLLAAVPASAQTILGTTLGGSSSTLVEIDPATGAVLTWGHSVDYLVNGLVWDAAGGVLYATTSVRDPRFPSGLITIDPVTGASTRIGGGSGLVGATVCAAMNSAGQLYSWWDPSQDDLLLWDTTTGLATRVGDSGLSTMQHGIAFDASDVLYLVNSGGSVYTIDTTTGAATSVGSIGVTAHHGEFHPTTGLYYGIDNTGGGPKNLVVADLTTFSVVSTLPTADSLHTVTFYNGAQIGAATIPTVSPWGAIVMTLLLVVAGGVLLRRFM